MNFYYNLTVTALFLHQALDFFDILVFTLTRKEGVTIGGGSGTPGVNEAAIIAGIDHIDSISAVFDRGGATGRRRVDSRGQEIAFSDPMRILLSLVNPALHDSLQYKALVELLTSRYWDRVLGQEIFAHFHKNGDGFNKVQKLLSELTGIDFMGKVIPSTTYPTDIKFSTKFKRTYTGEDQLDAHYMSEDMVVKMWLADEVPAYQEAMDVIENTPLVIFSCGSINGSVLCNCLPIGMKEAFQRSKAKMYLITNLVSTRNETHAFTPLHFPKLIRKYSGIRLTGLIVPEMTRLQFENQYPDVSEVYASDHAYFLGWEDSELYSAQSAGIEIITHQATKIVETPDGEKIVRHDPGRLAEAIEKLLAYQ